MNTLEKIIISNFATIWKVMLLDGQSRQDPGPLLQTAKLSLLQICKSELEINQLLSEQVQNH